MFANDLDIPAKYGILQSVGDTTGPGGISRALRAIPTYVDYARQIAEYCPAAWVINYTNPMTLCTATLYAAFPQIKAFGCCHEVFGTQKRLSELVAHYWDVPEPARQEIKLDVTGVNHFTFATATYWEGIDLYPMLREHIADAALWADQTEWSLERRAKQDYIPSKGLVAFNFLRLFGVLGAAGDRHLAEFVPWYLVSEETLHRYGVTITPSSDRLRARKPKSEAAFLMEDGQYLNPLVQSDEESVAIMLALLGRGDLTTNVNLPNRGQAPDLPPGQVVETNAQFQRDWVTPVVAQTLPPAVNSLVRRVMDGQKMTLEAGLNRDKSLAFAALLADPLCRLPLDAAWAMFNEMLAANKAMLPGWEIA
jgi:alpha-galactosidase